MIPKANYFVRTLSKHTLVFRTPDYKIYSLTPRLGSNLPDGIYHEWVPDFPNGLKESRLDGVLANPPRNQEQKKVIHFNQLYLIATGQCNYACKYCAQSKSNIGNMPKSMMLDTVKRFLELSPDPQGIVFYGGEPLLNWEAIRESIAFVNDRNPGIEITIFTNGSLVDARVASFISSHKVGVIVSLDGPPSVHNSARIGKSSTNGFEKAVRGYYLLKESNCRTGISCVIGPHNFQQIDEVTHFLCSLNPTNIGMNILHSAERSSYGFSPQLGAEAVVRAAQIASEYHIEIEQFARRLRSFVFETVRYGDCPACGRRLAVTPQGKLGPCEGAFPFVTEWFFDNFSEVENLSRKLALWPCSNQACLTCEANGLCGGGCVLDAYLSDSCLTGMDDRTCELSKAVVGFALDTLDQSGIHWGENTPVSIEDKQQLFSRYLTMDKARPLQTSSNFGENMGKQALESDV